MMADPIPHTSTEMYCNECAAAMELEGHWVALGVSTDQAVSCASCGKTRQQEWAEQAENQQDDEEMAPEQLDPQVIYPAAVNVSADDSSVYELKRQHDKGRINLSPKFQRHNVWTNRQKSELIESILMGIPLPIMYFFENKKGVKQVIDGKQRLTTLFDYLENRFPLTELPVLHELKGKKFADLTGMQQGKIEDYKLSINVIKPPTPERIKFDIFDRVNRGGTRLNNQEMRNAIYQGQATELLERLANLDSFKQATDNSVRSRVMKDRYIVLRFLAFYLWRTQRLIDENGTLVEYKSDIDSFLGKTMEFLNSCPESFIANLFETFDRAMQSAFETLGKDGFRVSTYTDRDRRTSVSMALFEVLAYCFTHQQVQQNTVMVKGKIEALFMDDEFLSAITTPVDSSTKVVKRFSKVEQLIRTL